MFSMEHMGHGHHHHLGFNLGGLDPLAFAGFAAVFSYSFIMSWHCVGMCGPLACSVLGRSRPRLGWATTLYHLGRVISYCSAGALVGLASEAIRTLSLQLGTWLSLVLGCLLVLWAVGPWLIKRPRLWPTRSLLPDLQNRLHRRLASQQGLKPAFVLGLLTVLLPCMTLHPLLLAAAGTQSAISGASTLLAFSLGTIPALASATYMPTLMGKSLPSRWLLPLGRLFMIFAGLITIARAWPEL